MQMPEYDDCVQGWPSQKVTWQGVPGKRGLLAAAVAAPWTSPLATSASCAAECRPVL